MIIVFISLDLQHNENLSYETDCTCNYEQQCVIYNDKQMVSLLLLTPLF